MKCRELKKYITEQYHSEEEHLWAKFPNYGVFRHNNNKKWFAVVMNIPKSRLGFASDEMIDILDVKCDPVLIGSLLGEKGFYPAYHMHKSSWITVALDGSVDDEKIKWLLDISYDLTATKIKRKP